MLLLLKPQRGATTMGISTIVVCHPFILALVTLFLPLPSAAAITSWTCGLYAKPLENVPISPEQQQELLKQQQQQQSLDGGGRGSIRNLLRVPWAMDAIFVSVSGREEEEEDVLQYRRITVVANNSSSTTISLFDQSGNSNIAANITTNAINATEAKISGTTLYHEGRRCSCGNTFLFNNGLLDENEQFYCPTPANQCSVWITRSGDNYDYGVRCFKDMSWAVTTARQLWYYIVFWFVLLALYPIFTRPGHHAVKYLLSRCFPRMNVWITEQLLQEEIRTNERIREDFERAARSRRQRDGEITGYSIKTKRHSKTLSNDEVLNSTTLSNIDGSVVGAAASSEDARENNKCSEDSAMCTICLLELEDGDRIADLGCGHFYHAECLGEWVLKKNSCPLCQDQGVATEIRYFESTDESTSIHDNESRFRRWRRKTRRIVLDIVTGGHPPLRDEQIISA